MFLKLQGQVDLRDLKLYTYPPESKLKEINCLSVCLGSIKWNPKEQSKDNYERIKMER